MMPNYFFFLAAFLTVFLAVFFTAFLVAFFAQAILFTSCSILS